VPPQRVAARFCSSGGRLIPGDPAYHGPQGFDRRARVGNRAHGHRAPVSAFLRTAPSNPPRTTRRSGRSPSRRAHRSACTSRFRPAGAGGAIDIGRSLPRPRRQRPAPRHCRSSPRCSPTSSSAIPASDACWSRPTSAGSTLLGRCDMFLHYRLFTRRWSR
jgi:hypothetical protein